MLINIYLHLIHNYKEILLEMFAVLILLSICGIFKIMQKHAKILPKLALFRQK